MIGAGLSPALTVYRLLEDETRSLKIAWWRYLAQPLTGVRDIRQFSPTPIFLDNVHVY